MNNNTTNTKKNNKKLLNNTPRTNNNNSNRVNRVNRANNANIINIDTNNNNNNNNNRENNNNNNRENNNNNNRENNNNNNRENNNNNNIENNNNIVENNNNNNNKNIFAKEFVTIMLESVHIIKLYHWKTKSYATHKATDGLHSKLGDLLDRYVEVLIGKANLNLKMSDYSELKIKNLENNEAMEKFIQDLIKFLLKVHKKLNMEKDVDLFTLRDELISELNRFLYLLRLN